MPLAGQYPRPSITFHRTFPLVRPAVAELVKLACESAGPITRQAIRESTNLGSIYIEAMPRYARGCGLLGSASEPTIWGKMVYQNDLLLDYPGTQWLMHYHLSAPHGPGPAFWHELVVTRFRTGNEFTTDEIVEQITEFAAQTLEKPLVWRSARSTATVFLGTYTKSDGLGRLGILEACGSERYQVLSPEPPVWAAACALLDYWPAQFGERVSVNLSDLTTERGFAGLLLMGDLGLDRVLSAMQSEGYVEIYRTAPPYQVLLLRREVEPLLRRVYGLG